MCVPCTHISVQDILQRPVRDILKQISSNGLGARPCVCGAFRVQCWCYYIVREVDAGPCFLPQVIDAMDVDMSDDSLAGNVVSTPQPVVEMEVEAVWLTDAEQESFQQWKDNLPLLLAGYTFAFTAIHLLSVLFTGHMDTSGMPAKYRSLWHNKCVRISAASMAYTLPDCK